MVLELHIWGPAFSLPSVDPQCIAAVAYLTQAVPRGEWRLVASGDASLSPTHDLPALKNDNVWVGGFRNIVDYIRQFSRGKWDLDAELEGRERADCIAFSSFVEAHGQPLLDLSLYVSSQNYSTITRPIYTAIQTFPLAYFTPSSIRSAAKSRTSHLGLSSLDIDSDPTTSSPEKEPSIIPASLRVPRTTVSSLLSQSPENAAQIRLDALASTFFSPLQALRGKKRFFLSQSATSLDCVALGYLSLALLPDLPSPWLAKCMRGKYPQLCAFVHELQSSFFGGACTLEDAFLNTPASEIEKSRNQRASGKGILPWSPPSRPSLTALSALLGSSIADSIPLISDLRKTTQLKSDLDRMAGDENERAEAAHVISVQQKEIWTTAATIVAGLGAFVGFVMYYGLLGGGIQKIEDHQDTRSHAAGGDWEVVGDGEEEAGNGEGSQRKAENRNGSGKASGLDAFGEAGAILGALPVFERGGSHMSPSTSTHVHDEPLPHVDVDVELVDRVH